MKVKAPPFPIKLIACMLNKYFELAYNNNPGESLSFVVDEIVFKVAVMTSSVARISFLWLRSL